MAGASLGEPGAWRGARAGAGRLAPGQNLPLRPVDKATAGGRPGVPFLPYPRRPISRRPDCIQAGAARGRPREKRVWERSWFGGHPYCPLH